MASLKQIGCLALAVAVFASVAEAKTKRAFDASFLKSGLTRPVISLKVIGKRDGIKIWMLTFDDQSVIAMSNDELERRQTEFRAKQNPALNVSQMKSVGFAAAHSRSAIQVAILPPVKAKRAPQLYGVQSERTCEALSEKDLAAIEQEYGTNLTTFMAKAVLPLHQQPRLSRAEVYSKTSSFYNIDGWANFAGAATLPQGEPSRRFTALLASKILNYYMDNVSSYSRDESRAVRNIAIDEEVRARISQRISQFAVEPRIKYVQESTCSAEHSYMRLCQPGQAVLLVTAQMSPHVSCYCDLVKSSTQFCSDYRSQNKFRVTYVVTPQPNGTYQIIDVKLFGQSLVRLMTADVISVGPEKLLEVGANL